MLLIAEEAARLLTSRFFALVLPGQCLRMAKTTYLADGAQYFPVFTDTQCLQKFLASQDVQLPLVPQQLTMQTLMAQVNEHHLNGLLLNPGAQSLPISLSYWRYINRVLPVVDPALDAVEIVPNGLDLSPLLARLAKGVAGVSQIDQLWLTPLKLSAKDSLCLAVIADYRGFAVTFDTEVALRLASVCRPLVPIGVDILVGSLNDALGRLVAAQTTSTAVLKQA